MLAAAWIGECDGPPPTVAARRVVHVLLGGDPGPFGRHRDPREGRSVVIPARPGRGGRRPRVDRSYLTEQTRELIDELGEPLLVARSYQATTNIWDFDADGDGILAARLSADDLRGGETIFAQIHALRALADREDLRPRYVVVSLRMSGTRYYEHRIDLAFTIDKVRLGETGWVAWRGPDRIARETLPGELYYHHLRRAGGRLFISDLGREVDWESDRVYLSTHHILSEQEIITFRRRAHTPIMERYVKPGKGWPGSVKYGFMRDLRGWVVVDPEAWRYIEEIHYGFATLREDGRASLRAMQRHVETLGCPMSHGKVRAILSDPIYVTGEWSNTIGGEVVHAKRIEIANPIPPDVFARNQSLLALNRGKHTTNPVGTFLLNAVAFRHAACGDQTTDDKPVVMRGRSSQDRLLRYRHYPSPPTACHGYTLDAAAVDACVVRALLRLAESPELQAAWMQNALTRAREGEEGYHEVITTPERREDLNTRIRALEAQKARLLREYVDAAADGATPDTGSLRSLLDALDSEIASHKRLLELAERIEAYRQRSEPAPEQRELLARLREVLTVSTPSEPDQRQRRAAIVAAALSEVIVHDLPEGPALELRGPLLATDAPLVPLDPASAAAGALRRSGSSDADGLPTVHYRHAYETVWKPTRPAWISPYMPLPGDVPRRLHTRETQLGLCREAVAVLEPLIPPGRIRGAVVAGAWDRRAHDHGYPPIRAVRKMVNRQGLTITDLYRSVMGVEAALRRGRSGPRTVEELVLTLSWAIEDGFTVGSGWRTTFDDFRHGRPYLVTPTRVRQLAKQFGVRPADVWEQASVRAGSRADDTDRL